MLAAKAMASMHIAQSAGLDFGYHSRHSKSSPVRNITWSNLRCYCIYQGEHIKLYKFIKSQLGHSNYGNINNQNLGHIY